MADEAIVFGSWACAGSISKISWFKGNIDKWAGKKLIVFCVGASPIENPEVEIALSQIFNESERKKARSHADLMQYLISEFVLRRVA